jgi:hypothetical protein
MPGDFFDPTPEQQVVVLVESATLRQADRLIGYFQILANHNVWSGESMRDVINGENGQREEKQHPANELVRSPFGVHGNILGRFRPALQVILGQSFLVRPAPPSRLLRFFPAGIKAESGA